MTNIPGQLIIVSAPSGGGKTTLVHRLLAADSRLKVGISWTTRQMRAGEVDGEHYHFVSQADFLRHIDAKGFLEWAEVHGRYYGTPRQQVSDWLTAGYDVILEIDWQGAQQVRSHVLANDEISQLYGIFIVPPSFEGLKSRLTQRGTESAESIALRLENARQEMMHAAEYDYLVVNDDLAQAFAELQQIIAANRLCMARQHQKIAQILQECTTAN